MSREMDAEERAKMEAMGYAVVDDAAEWLELTAVERQIVEFRVSLGLGRSSPQRCSRAVSSQAGRDDGLVAIEDCQGRREQPEGVTIDLLDASLLLDGRDDQRVVRCSLGPRVRGKPITASWAVEDLPAEVSRGRRAGCGRPGFDLGSPPGWLRAGDPVEQAAGLGLQLLLAEGLGGVRGGRRPGPCGRSPGRARVPPIGRATSSRRRPCRASGRGRAPWRSGGSSPCRSRDSSKPTEPSIATRKPSPPIGIDSPVWLTRPSATWTTIAWSSFRLGRGLAGDRGQLGAERAGVEDRRSGRPSPRRASSGPSPVIGTDRPC